MQALVTGAGGMIGGHLVRRLLDEGHDVRATDIKRVADWWQVHQDAENLPRWDMGNERLALIALDGIDHVYSLACLMGGIQFIESARADCSTSVLTTAQTLKAAVKQGASRFLLTSSACVYRADRQDTPDQPALREEDAWPAQPEPGYGEAKLHDEQMATYFRQDFGLETRIARLHNAYGTHCTWEGGKEKAPAAICRKVAEAVVSGDHHIEIYGDGRQTRSFMWMGDCIEGIRRIMDCDYPGPLNLGSSELVTINELVTIVEDIAGVRLERSYDLNAPQGVRGRNSDNTLIRATLGWEPTTALRDGLAVTYEWVLNQVRRQLAA
jgi:GDP-D-mannose 3',5'-epimerase